MEKNWDYPRKGIVKINVHAVSYPDPLPNCIDSGIGIVIRDERGDIVVMVSGTIPRITPRANELWSLLAALRLAYYENQNQIQLESENVDGLREWKEWKRGIDPNHVCVIQQLQQRKKDPNLTLEINSVTKSQNRLARYLAVDGAHNRKRLVIFCRSFGRVGELWRLDMGLGPVEARFQTIRENEYVNGDVQVVGEDRDWLVADVGSAAKFE